MLYLKLFETEAERVACQETQEYVSYTVDTDKVNIHLYDYSQDYLTFVAKSDGTFKFSGISNEHIIQYSTDNGKTWSNAAQIVEINVQNGDSVLWKGNMTPIDNEYPIVGNCGIGTFSGSTSYFDVKGNAMSLLFGANYANQTSLSDKNCAFASLFFYAKIIDANNLILQATTLSDYCYAYIFQGCTSLTTAPQLPATTLANHCYRNMFYDCASLTIAPQLNATTLFDGCYYNMFGGCTTLTTAPELRATNLVHSCYQNMFNGCTNLNYITMLATNISGTSCLSTWVKNVAASGTFVKASSMTTLPSGANGIPNGWSIQNK